MTDVTSKMQKFSFTKTMLWSSNHYLNLKEWKGSLGTKGKGEKYQECKDRIEIIRNMT